MSKIKKILNATLAGSMVTMAASAVAFDWDKGLIPYVGLDAQYRSMEFKKDRGNNIAAKSYPQGNIFVGLRFCDYWGVEFGYQGTNNKKRDVTLQPTDRFLGV